MNAYVDIADAAKRAMAQTTDQDALRDVLTRELRLLTQQAEGEPAMNTAHAYRMFGPTSSRSARPLGHKRTSRMCLSCFAVKPTRHFTRYGYFCRGCRDTFCRCETLHDAETLCL